MRKALIYVRVSDPAQERGTSLQNQIRQCTDAALAEGYMVRPDDVLVEQFTGSVMDRPVLNKARVLAATGEYDALFVLVPDRLSRNPVHLLMLMEDLSSKGVSVRFVSGISNDSPEGQLLLFVEGYVARREREHTARRTMEGKRDTASGGRLPCGGPLFGYHYDPIAKIRTINEEEAAVVRLMFQMAFEGVSPYLIGVDLTDRGIRGPRGGVLEARSVRRMLRNESYTGIDYYGLYRCIGSKGQKRSITARDPSEAIRITGFTPPIISRELFDEVQERLKTRQAKSSSDRFYLLTGFTRCISCGGPVVGSCLARQYPRYRCRCTQRTAKRPASCHERYIPGPDLEEAVWSRVREVILQPELLVAELGDHFQSGGGDTGEAMAALRRDETRLLGEQQKLLKAYRSGFFDQSVIESDAASVKNLLEEKRRALALLEEQQRREDDTIEVERRVIERCREFSDSLDGLDGPGKRAVLAAFGVKVQASKTDLLITLTVSPKCPTIGRTSESMLPWRYVMVLKPRPGEWFAVKRKSSRRKRPAR